MGKQLTRFIFKLFLRKIITKGLYLVPTTFFIQNYEVVNIYFRADEAEAQLINKII